VSTYPYLVATNMSSYYDWKVSLYLAYENAVYYTNATGNYTKADSIYLPAGYYPKRFDYLGNLNVGTNLTWTSDMIYYNFVQNFLYSDAVNDCPAPYNNYTNINCFDYS
jgi:hypothetical protein